MRLELIEMIYSAVDDISRWSLFLDAFLEGSIFAAAAVGYQSTMRDILITGILRGADEPSTEQLFSEIIPNNPLMMTGLVLSYGPHVMVDSDVMPREQFVQTAYYRWQEQIGAHGMLIGVFRDRPDGAVHFPCYVRRGERVTEAQRAEMGVLLPHLSQALALSRQLATLRALCGRSLIALDGAHFGCALLNERGKLEWLNQYAEHIISREEVLCLRDGKLLAKDSAYQSVLDAQFDQALGLTRGQPGAPQRSVVMLPKVEAQGHVELLYSALSPFGHPMIDDCKGVLVILADPDYVEEGVAGRLEQLYGLTPAEAEATQWLLSGSSIEQIAQIAGKSEHTVRNQLKSVMRKCNVSSQAQLVGLIHRGLGCLSS